MRRNTGLGERLISKREALGFSSSYQLAKHLNIRNSVIWALETGRRTKSKHLTTIAKALLTTTEYLLTGSVRLKSSIPSVYGPNAEFLTLDNKVPVIPIIKWHEVLTWKGFDMERASEYETVPLHTGGAKGFEPSNECFALRIIDDSMQCYTNSTHSFIQGDVIIIDPKRPVKDNNYVIATISDDTKPIFRQLVNINGDIFLSALNSLIPPIPFSDDVKIHGVLIAHQRNYF